MRSSRKTQIIATIGPACWTHETLRRMVAAGMDVARLNFSHGTHETHAEMAARVRAAAEAEGRRVLLLADLQGAKVRIGDVGRGLDLQPGQAVVLSAHADHVPCDIPVPGVSLDVAPGDTLLLDDGLIALTVEACDDERVVCRVRTGGHLTSHKGLTLPPGRQHQHASALSAKDLRDMAFAVSLGVEWVAVSFVRSASDIEQARAALTTVCQGRATPRLMAKIETREAVEHLDDIIAAADGVMVARGDLGLELPPEEVPLVQKRIIRRCNRAGKPVVTATQMLASMEHHPRPTRAEVSDVANAVMDGTTAVMLSGETATGCYPVEAVAMMRTIIERVERELDTPITTSPGVLRHLLKETRDPMPYSVPVRVTQGL
ncbi:pyruvate kinase [Ardenticatena maritima]|nr:pyruvate kinase [Ardenticatena maritima]